MTSRRFRKAVSDTWAPVRRLRDTLGVPLWSPLKASILPLVLDSIFQAAGPLALRLAIDRVTEQRFAIACASVVACVAAFGASRGMRALLLHRFDMAATRLRTLVAEKVYRHVFDLPYAVQARRSTGEFERKAAEGINGLRSMQGAVAFGMLPLLLQATMITIVLLSIGQGALLTVLMGSMAMYGWLFVRGVRAQRAAYREAAQAESSFSGTVVDTLLNYETVKLFSGEAGASRRVDQRLGKCEERWREVYRVRRRADMAAALLFVIIMLAVLLLVVERIAAGALTAGSFVLVSAYTIQLIAPIEAFGSASREFTQALGHAERLGDILADPTEGGGGGVQVPRDASLDVRLTGVQFGYHPGQLVLDGIDMVIPAGKVVAVVGPSGSGKTTLARLLMGLHVPQGGSIEVAGHDLASLDRHSLRGAVAVVAQDTILFNDTLRYNIAFAAQDADETAVVEAARHAGLTAVIDGSPEGWETIVGERGLRLSGGERQRVAIARAILRRPGLFIFDEATASLDSTTERQIQQSLDTVSRGVATLIIAHRLSTVRDADEIIVLGSGRVVERGTHDDLLLLDGTYASMWHAQRGRVAGVSAT